MTGPGAAGRVAGAAAALALGVCCAPPSADYAATRLLLGTVVTARAVAADEATARRATAAALAAAAEVNAVAAYENRNSELNRLNRAGAAGAVKVSPTLLEIIRVAVGVAAATDGYFDPTVAPLVDLYGIKTGTPRWPGDDEVTQALAVVGYEGVIIDGAAGTVRFERAGMALDLGGIAPGYAADRAATAMRAAGARAGIVDMGGEVVCFGGGPRGDAHWRVGIKHPRKAGLYGRIALADGGCATSGDYEQRFTASGRAFTHFFDPHTGRPVEYAASVTVVAPTCAAADAWATALAVMPPAKAAAALRAPGAPPALLLRADGARVTSEVWGAFPRRR